MAEYTHLEKLKIWTGHGREQEERTGSNFQCLERLCFFTRLSNASSLSSVYVVRSSRSFFSGVLLLDLYLLLLVQRETRQDSQGFRRKSVWWSTLLYSTMQGVYGLEQGWSESNGGKARTLLQKRDSYGKFVATGVHGGVWNMRMMLLLRRSGWKLEDSYSLVLLKGQPL